MVCASEGPSESGAMGDRRKGGVSGWRWGRGVVWCGGSAVGGGGADGHAVAPYDTVAGAPGVPGRVAAGRKGPSSLGGIMRTLDFGHVMWGMPIRDPTASKLLALGEHRQL